MIVLVDPAWRGPTGIGRYAAEVLARAPEGMSLRYLPAVDAPAHPLRPWQLGRQVAADDGSVFWSPGFVPPVRPARPFVVTVHDLVHRQWYGRRKRWYYDFVFRPLLRRAAALITVSDASQRLIAEWLGVPPARICVSRTGFDAGRFFPAALAPAPRPYILYLGNSRPNKNLPRAIAAFARARLGAGLEFWIAGNRDPHIAKLIRRSGQGARIRLLGHVAEGDIPDLYRRALAFFLPSLAEGFGLPVLEAMACGTPVLTSPVPAAVEAGGDAVWQVDPTDVDSMAAGLERVLGDAALRVRMKNKGLERASDPRWGWEAIAGRVWATVRMAGALGGVIAGS